MKAEMQSSVSLGLQDRVMGEFCAIIELGMVFFVAKVSPNLGTS